MPLLRAMQRRAALGTVAAGLLLVAGVVACAPDSVTRMSPTSVARNVTTSDARVLKVCTGDGPAGTYTYQLTNIVPGAGTRGTLTTPLGTTFSVPSGSCVDAAVLTFPSIESETDIPTSVTVTQVARPAGTNFKYIQATALELTGPTDVCLAPANFPCGQDTQVFSPSTAIVINEYHGSVLSFFHDWGSLGDFVWTDTNGNGIQDAGEAGIPGQTVTLSGTVSGTTVTGPNGEYAFTGLPAGTYTVSVGTPTGMTPSPVGAAGSTPSNDSNGSGTSVSLAAGETNPTIDFGFVPPAPPPVGGFATYTQGGWGSTPHGNNPGQLLATNFSVVYPSGSVAIGGTRTLTFTSAAAIMNFLPQGSTPGTLAASATNPTTSAAGVFAGQVLALRLSVSFSSAGITKSGLGAMRLTSGKLAGSTVGDVLALANSVLGGNVGALPAGVTLSDLNNVVDLINNNFDGGTTNNGYLTP